MAPTFKAASWTLILIHFEVVPHRIYNRLQVPGLWPRKEGYDQVMKRKEEGSIPSSANSFFWPQTCNSKLAVVLNINVSERKVGWTEFFIGLNLNNKGWEQNQK